MQQAVVGDEGFGLEGEFPPDLSIGLGTMGITPLDLTAAYTAFSNQGVRAVPWGVAKVEDRKGAALEQGAPELVRAIPEDTAYILQNLLRGVVQHGTGWRAKAIGRPVGGKTPCWRTA